eukprot:2530280-Amphidinium_carterae.2
MRSPFGSLVYAMPPRTRKHELHVFEPKFVPCVSMGPLVLSGGRIGSAMRVLPLELFVKSGGLQPSRLWITRDWLHCDRPTFPLREIAEARIAVGNISEDAFEVGPPENLHGFMLSEALRGDDVHISSETVQKLDAMLLKLPMPETEEGKKRLNEPETVVGVEGGEEKPFPSWHDDSIIEPAPDVAERRLPRTRVDRMFDGSLLLVKRNSRRPPWWCMTETWMQLPLKDREKEIERWRSYHSEGLTLGEVRKRERHFVPPMPAFVKRAQEIDPSVDVRSIPVPALPLVVDHDVICAQRSHVQDNEEMQVGREILG